MSLKIRLARGGAKKRPFYRIVVADSRSPRDGRYIEKIGVFDPLKAKDATDRVVLEVEKAKAWLGKGAQPTDRVARILDAAGLLKREARNNPEKAKPKKKAQAKKPSKDKPKMQPPATNMPRMSASCPEVSVIVPALSLTVSSLAACTMSALPDE